MKTLQNLATVTITDVGYTEVDGAIDIMEKHFGGFNSLTAEQKRVATKGGEKSELFCSKTLRLMGQHRDILPVSLSLEDALADQHAREQLRPRIERLLVLVRKLLDTDFALASDVMSAALHGYRLLKVNGRGHGLESLDIGSRFAKKRRAVTETPVPEEKAKR